MLIVLFLLSDNIRHIYFEVVINFVNSIEQLRCQVVKELMALSTIKKVWPHWLKDIRRISSDYTALSNNDLKIIGNDLYNIFRQTTNGTRSQGEVAAGGTAWESLICWYLNLCLVGSRTVVIKAKKNNIPQAILDSISVNYGNFKSNTESDLLAITFPNNNELLTPVSESHHEIMQRINRIVSDNFTDTELTVIQCKTNWNDNAQIPMLWDLIYSSEGFTTDTTVGSGGYSHKKLKKFSYAFVTVPTVDPDKIKQTSTCVQRVLHLSGGNYWGRPSKSGVAMNIFDIMNRNFQTSLNFYPSGWNKEISDKLKYVYENGNYFQL